MSTRCAAATASAARSTAPRSSRAAVSASARVSAAMIWLSTRSSGSLGWISRPMSTVQPRCAGGPAGLPGDAQPQVGVALEAQRPAEPGDRGGRGAAALGQLDDGRPGGGGGVGEDLLGHPLQGAGELGELGPQPDQKAARGARRVYVGHSVGLLPARFLTVPPVKLLTATP